MSGWVCPSNPFMDGPCPDCFEDRGVAYCSLAPLKMPQTERCSWCGGFGIVQSYPDSTPDECRKCGGTGLVEKRDERGRFLPWVER